MAKARETACAAVEKALQGAGLAWEKPKTPEVPEGAAGAGTPCGPEGGNAAATTYVVQLPGTRKLSTTCSLVVGRHTLTVQAFVVRRPDENHEAVHRWLLEHNLRIYGVCYAIDRLGDIYLVGRLPLAAVTPEEVDRVLGAVVENADGSFNTLLELGFANAIRKEYEWRTARGESTRNLEAFRHLTGTERRADA
ncbi:MAG: YbjN domain-containing protein [Streptomycetaceae bacterium]|nr:YbjN domain-containing protein [Streptomycetaceae bacterium]